MANKNLTLAKSNKNNEFYTQLVDIEKELQHYSDQLIGKIIYCNCDSIESNFVKYFTDNFTRLQLKGFIHSSVDFRSDESRALLSISDIVITNPPFSLFREYIAQLVEYDKKFLVIGNNNAITCKEIFPLLKGNKMWLGISPRSMSFVLPDNSLTDVNANWFTNMDHKKRYDKLILGKNYDPLLYPKYDNYDAINVDKVVDIPEDYDGIMGVPITFLDKYNPEQFEIVAKTNNKDHAGVYLTGKDPTAMINGKKLYHRILIKKVNNNTNIGGEVR